MCRIFFADGLMAIGAVDMLIDIAGSMGAGAISVTIITSVFIASMAVLIGSGNAAFFPMAKIAPIIAAKLGIPAVNLILPLNLVVGIGRSVSPISAVVIACSDIAQVSPTEAIKKRSAAPMAVAFVSVVTLSLLFA